MNKWIAFLLSIAFLVSCEEKCPNDKMRDITVAAILDLSGHYSQFGIESRHALMLMSSNNFNLKIKYYDSRGVSTVADSILDVVITENELTNIVTLTSWISNDLADKISRNKLLHFPIGAAAFSNSNLMSSVMMTERVENESAYLLNRLASYARIAIMYFNNDYGTTWFNTLSNGLSGKVVAHEVYADNQTDFSAELSRIAVAHPDVVVLISTREAAIIMNQAAGQGLQVQFYGTRPILTDALLAEPTAEGLIFSYPRIDYNNPLIREFQSTFGYKPGSFSGEGIDLCLALIGAAGEKKYLPDEVFDHLKNTTLHGAFNPIHFDGMCRANYEFTLMQVKNGSFEEIQ